MERDPIRERERGSVSLRDLACRARYVHRLRRAFCEVVEHGERNGARARADVGEVRGHSRFLLPRL